MTKKSLLNEMTLTHSFYGKIPHEQIYAAPAYGGVGPGAQKKYRFKMRLDDGPKMRLNHTVIPTKQEKRMYYSPNINKAYLANKRHIAADPNANSFTSGYDPVY